MDILISVNTLHYECGIMNICDALRSFSNVLRPGGVALIETAAPHHFFVQSSVRKEELCFESRWEDFRKGDLFGFFETEDHFRKYLQKEFSEVEVLTLTEKYATLSLCFFIGICRK